MTHPTKDELLAAARELLERDASWLTAIPKMQRAATLLERCAEAVPPEGKSEEQRWLDEACRRTNYKNWWIKDGRMFLERSSLTPGRIDVLVVDRFTAAQGEET